MRLWVELFGVFAFIAMLARYVRLRAEFETLYGFYSELRLRSGVIERERDEARQERDQALFNIYRPEPTEKSV